MAVIPERIDNVRLVMPILHQQCDSLIINLIGFGAVPDFLFHHKNTLNHFASAGSEIRFFDFEYQKSDTYYFTVDDDILYPPNYSQVMVQAMKSKNNKAVFCVHGSILNLHNELNYYMNGRKVYHFKSPLDKDTLVMLPGVGTSCFYKGSVDLSYDDFYYKNMSDVFVGCFLAKKKLPVYAIKRDSNWLQPLPTFGKSIWGSNPKLLIDDVINQHKNYFINVDLSRRVNDGS